MVWGVSIFVAVHGLMCLVFRCFTFYFANFVAKFGNNLIKNIKNTVFFAIKTRERLPIFLIISEFVGEP
jgi:hypothetical protein